MRWNRIAGWTTLILAIAIVALGTPIVVDHLETAAQKRNDEPDPVPASPAEAHAIVADLFDQADFQPGPAGPGVEPSTHSRKLVVVATQSLCFSDGDASGSGCFPPLMAGVDVPETDSAVPLKMRKELLLANRTSRPLDLKGIAWAIAANRAQVRHLLAHGNLDAFHREFPGTAGLVEITWPVLTRDRHQALVLVSHWCGGMCGTGNLYLMQRYGSGWRIAGVELLWVS